MSDIEEPPSKVRRYEMSSQFLEGEVEEDGQEEWLSEGILTDDDYNTIAEQDQIASNNDTSQDDTFASNDNSMENLTDSQESIDGQNISVDGQNISVDGQNISVDGQNISVDGQNISVDGQNTSSSSSSRQNVSITGNTISIIGNTVSTVGKSFSTNVQNVSTYGNTVSTNVINVSTHGKTVSKNVQNVNTIERTVNKDLNSSLSVQYSSTGFAVTTQGRNFIVDGTKINLGGVQTQDFEEALENMEKPQHNQVESDFPEDLNAFLIRKKDGKLITGDPKIVLRDGKQSDIEESPKHSDAEDDGNDTDGLLRLLGDNDGKNKKYEDNETPDEEDFHSEGSKTKTLRVSKNVLTKKYLARKAVPVDEDITDASSDEEVVKQKVRVQRKVKQSTKVDTASATVQKPTRVQPKRLETSTPKKYANKLVEDSKATQRSKGAVKPRSLNTYPGAARSSLPGTALKSPVTATVKTPVTTTVKTPVTTTVKTPVTVKTPAVVKTPVTTNVKTPVTTTVKTPVSAKTPVTTTVKSPVTLKTPVFKFVDTPVTTATIRNPVKSPITTMLKTPVTVKNPFISKLKNPFTTAVKIPSVTTAVKASVTSTVKAPVITTKTPVVELTRVDAPSEVNVAQSTKRPFAGIGTSKYEKDTSPQPKATSEPSKKKTDPKKNKNEESDDDKPLKSNVATEKPVIKPEGIDEEMTSDIESETDEESLYDELPSSEDESLNEWFTLDIRAERAGDYIPLLGDKAETLLLEEKERVTTRLDNLKKSLTALTDSSKEQAKKLRKATAELAALDAQIKAA